MAQHERISIDPNVMMGKPCLAGRRITVELVVRHMANGWSRETICDQYGLAPEDIEAALEYAADQLAKVPPTAAE